MNTPHPAIVLRDFDTGDVVFRLPWEQVKTYKAILAQAHTHAHLTAHDPALHLHIQGTECKGSIYEETWDNGFYIRYLIKNVGSRHAPKGEVEVFVHFSKERKERKVRFLIDGEMLGTDFVQKAEETEGEKKDGKGGRVRPRAVRPKPGVRRRDEGEEGDAGHAMGAGSAQLQATPAAAAAAVAAAQSKVDKLKKRISQYSYGKTTTQAPSLAGDEGDHTLQVTNDDGFEEDDTQDARAQGQSEHENHHKPDEASGLQPAARSLNQSTPVHPRQLQDDQPPSTPSPSQSAHYHGDEGFGRSGENPIFESPRFEEESPMLMVVNVSEETQEQEDTHPDRDRDSDPGTWEVKRENGSPVDLFM
ncbi:hypothetical protein P154DRAFT_560411 [Amniculicola lignicola CBS 123094]|uniref:Uncharacterized protein n=1 Tax=Amniculicola lignicola CBS 123094 TaxID=1392246 RepID=A0A6A5WSN0_9PLEO|nr:hypothetical protein P154DRAFT_560411 [Amniculicola lignicola CBS 123094]